MLRKSSEATAPPAEWPVKMICWIGTAAAAAAAWRLISCWTLGKMALAQDTKPLWAAIPGGMFCARV